MCTWSGHWLCLFLYPTGTCFDCAQSIFEVCNMPAVTMRAETWPLTVFSCPTLNPFNCDSIETDFGLKGCGQVLILSSSCLVLKHYNSFLELIWNKRRCSTWKRRNHLHIGRIFFLFVEKRVLAVFQTKSLKMDGWLYFSVCTSHLTIRDSFLTEWKCVSF